MSQQHAGGLPCGHATTAQSFADVIDAFPAGEFRRVDVDPALRDRVTDLSKTPIVRVVDQERTADGTRNVYRVHDEARRIATRTVAERDAICPCGHSGVVNHGDHFECGFDACDRRFDRASLSQERERA